MFKLWMTIYEPIKSHPTYKVNRNGEVLSKKGDRMFGYPNHNGYLRVRLDG